jgi:hypothetical protein
MHELAHFLHLLWEAPYGVGKIAVSVGLIVGGIRAWPYQSPAASAFSQPMYHNAFARSTDFSKVLEAGVLWGLLTALITALFVAAVLYGVVALLTAVGLLHPER